jgi:hypothetical protein
MDKRPLLSRLGRLPTFLRRAVKEAHAVVVAVIGGLFWLLLTTFGPWLLSKEASSFKWQLGALGILCGFVILILGIHLIGSYLTWEEEEYEHQETKRERDRLQAALSEKARKVELETDITSVGIAALSTDEHSPKWSRVELGMTIRNTGSIPSTARHFQLRIQTPDQNYISLAQDVELTELMRQHDGSLVLKDIPRSRHITPVVPGAAWDGIVTFAVAMSPEKLRGLVMELSYRDIQNASHIRPWPSPF